MKKTDFHHPSRPLGPTAPPRNSSPVATFDKILRAFDTGGFTYTDFLEQLNKLLATGVPAEELLEVLRRRELIEPLPRYAYVEVLGLLNDAKKREEQAAPAELPITSADDAPDQVPMPPDPSDEVIALTDRLQLAQQKLAAQQTNFVLLTKSYERAQAAELVSVERATELARESSHYQDELHSLQEALAVRDGKFSALQQELQSARGSLESEQRKSRESSEEATRKLNHFQAELRTLQAELEVRDSALATAGTALEAERSKTREANRALAASVAANDLAVTRGEDALNELNHYQAELQTLRDAVAKSDAALTEARRSLSERDSQLVALQLLAKGGAQLEVDIKAARSRAETAVSEMKASQSTAASLLTQRDRLQQQVASMQAKIDTYAGLIEESQSAAQRRESERVVEFFPLPQEQNLPPAQAQAAQVPTPAVAIASASARPSVRAAGLRPGKFLRPMALGAVILMLAGIAWYIAHREAPPPPEPPAVVVAAPAAGTVILDCPSCPAMTVLPAGRFKQGSERSDAPPFEKPLHWVAIERPIAMSTNAVTVNEFQQFITATNWEMQGCDTYDGQWKRHPENNWTNPGFTQSATHPVTCTSWEDAQAYAEWLSTKTGHKYRLPSASEWEYAARAGVEAVQPWNSDGSDACENANVADASAAKSYPGWTVFACDDRYVNTAPVGSFKANAFGLKDMLGNVFQWTEDCWHADYEGAPIDGSARDDGGCTERELRGGSWFSSPAYVRANYRNHFASDYRTSSVGIRLVREVEQ